MPLSVLVDGYLDLRDVCLSLPVVLGRDGITRFLHPQLCQEETAALRPVRPSSPRPSVLRRMREGSGAMPTPRGHGIACWPPNMPTALRGG